MEKNIDLMIAELTTNIRKVTKDIDLLEKKFNTVSISENNVKAFAFTINDLIAKINKCLKTEKGDD